MPTPFDVTAPNRVAPLADPHREYVVGGSWGQVSTTGGFLLAGADDDVVRRHGPRVYQLMQYDSAVSSSLGLLKAGAMADGLQLAPAISAAPGEVVSQRKRKAELQLATETTDYCNRQVERLEQLDRPIDETVFELLDALAYGAALAEPVYELADDGPDKGRECLSRLAIKPSWAWAFRVDPFLRVRAIRAWTAGGWVDVGREHFLLFSWQPPAGDPRGSSVLRAAFTPWNLRVQTYPDYGEYLKKFASKSLVLTAGPDSVNKVTIDPLTGARVETKVTDELVAAGLAFKNHSVLGLPHGAAAHVLESHGTGLAFGNAYDRFDLEIFRAIILATRPIAEAKHGSKADSQSGMDLMQMAIQRVRDPLCHILRRDVFRRAVALNWGPDVAARFTPTVNFGIQGHLKPDLMTAFALAWSKGLFTPFHLPWIWSEMGAPIPDPDELAAMLTPPHPDATQGQSAAPANPDGPMDAGTGPGEAPPGTNANGKAAMNRIAGLMAP